jgi:hypothetical protein
MHENHDQGTGYISTFERAGFKVVERRVPPRLIVRYEFHTQGERPPQTALDHQAGNNPAYRVEVINERAELTVIEDSVET